MKHAFPTLVLAGAALAGILSACGGSGGAPNAHSPDAPPTDALAPALLAQSSAVAGLAAQRWGAPPDGRAAPTAQPLQLLIADGQATVCQLKLGALMCAVVEAPLPAGTMVNYWHLSDGTEALTYARAPGVQGIPDPDGAAAIRFQAAFNGAAGALLAHPASNARARGRLSNSMVCENEDCVEDTDIPVVDVPGKRGGGGGGAGGGGWDGGGGGGGEGGDGDGGNNDIPVLTVHGTPEPVSSIPTVIITGHYNPDIPLLPPRDPLYDLAELSSPCVVSPILTVCVRGKRPPLPPTEALPSGRMPWFPQTMCNWANIFCTSGQEPQDNDRGSDASTSGKTKVELDEICNNINKVEIDVCYGNIRPSQTGNWREFNICKRADARMFACFRTADRLTDYGQHPAP